MQTITRFEPRDRNSAEMDDIMGEVLRRLQTEYGIEL
jgi:hypothetical protein